MKKLLFVLLILFTATTSAQEGVKVKGNSMVVKDIAPVWPGCEEAKTNPKTCFQQKLVEHLKKHYKYPKDAQGQIIRGKSVVSFNINPQGKVQILEVQGESKELNAEAKRIILAIPSMKPGHRAGKPVAVKYKVPFTF
jgi:periplasmic protein TonB